MALREGWRRASVLGSLLLACAGCGLRAPALSSDGAPACTRVEFERPPRWTFSGLWIDSGRQLALADVASGSLLRYDRAGRLVEVIARPGGGILEFDRPVELVRADSGGGFLINGTDHILRLSESLEPEWGRRLADLPTGDGGTAVGERVHYLRSLVATDAGLVGLVEFAKRDNGEAIWAVARLQVDPGQEIALEHLVTLSGARTPAGDLYAMVMPLVARAGDAVYFLSFEGAPHLEQIVPARRSLSAFPEGYRSLADLPANNGPSTDGERYAALGRATLPVALFAARERLYVLTRKPRGAGGTTWHLHQVDPSKDRIIGAVELPSHSDHLVVVPGPVAWALVEKGPVEYAGKQAIDSVVFVATSWITDPRLAAASPTLSCDGTVP